MTARRSSLTARLEERDDYGIVLILILATIISVSLGTGTIGQFISVCLSGFTLLFVLHTSGARRRTFRSALFVVCVAVIGAAIGLLSGAEYGLTAAWLIGLMLAFAAPVIILRRILSAPTITVRVVLGALAIYLLIGLTYAYLYPVISAVTDQPFFVQTSTPGAVDYVYFSYVTLTTVGFGDFTAATSVGRMVAVSEALTGQLYLVSAVALLVGNIGRALDRGARHRDVGLGGDPESEDRGPSG
jgi:uncharacterized membrane protein